MTPSLPNPEAAKLRALQELAALDAEHPHTREAARTLRDLVANQLGVGGVRGDRLFALLCHAIARDGVPYRSDTQRTGGEDIAGLTRPPEHPFAVLRREGDDCDAKARLFVALCRAGGLQAEVIPLWKGGALQHVFSRVRLGPVWESAELTLSRARLGDEPQTVPYEKNKNDWART